MGEVENKWSVVSMFVIARMQRGILGKSKAQNSKVKRDFLGNTFRLVLLHAIFKYPCDLQLLCSWVHITVLPPSPAGGRSL